MTAALGPLSPAHFVQLPSHPIPGGSDGKESTCNARVVGLFPGMGRSSEGEGMATHSNILAWRIPMDRGAWGATVHGVAKSQIGLSDQAQHSTGPLRWGESENSGMFYFLGLQNPCGW